MIDQKRKERKNKFRCVVCGEWRKRGVMVQAKAGIIANLGLEMKTCQRRQCIEHAEHGMYEQVKKVGSL